MSTRDSGIIDLFAIHKEEEARQAATQSAPPPAFALDIPTGGADSDIDALAAARRASRTRAKLVGGAIGGLAVVGILVAAITTTGAKDDSAAAAAAAPPPPTQVATFVPPPPPAPDPVPAASTPAPPSTGSTDKADKPDYTRQSAAAAYAASQKKGGKFHVGKKAPSSGVKLQKVQSSGI